MERIRRRATPLMRVWDGWRTRPLAAVMVCGALSYPAVLQGEPIAVRFSEGLVHGFLALSALDGTRLADGDLIQVARGDRVTSRLVFRFKDGSIRDETAVFSQRQHFRLISDHVIQKGPTFPQTLDMSIDCTANVVTVRYTDDHGKPQVATERSELPPDLANGIILTLMKNIQANALPEAVSMVAATPKPRLVTLSFSVAGREPFSTGGSTHQATHFVVKIKVGGATGVLASLLGKQPPDSHVWILEGEAPAFVKSEGALYADGPLWRIELVSPVWRRESPAAK